MFASKSYTYFFAPFYFEDGDWEWIYANKLSKWKPWEPKQKDKEKGKENWLKSDVIYPYIMDLFGNNETKDSLFRIYEFDFQPKGTNSSLFVERILGKTNLAVVAENATARKTPKCIPFILCNEEHLAPRLIVSTSAHIGLLMFCVKFEDNTSLDDIKTLNYMLHKRNETDSYQCVCLKPENQDNINPDDLQALLNNDCFWKSKGEGKGRLAQSNTRKELGYLVWNLNDFVGILLATWQEPKDGENRVSYFSQDRLHLFTYCSIEDSANQLNRDDILKESLRLSRCANDKYLLPFDQLISQGTTLQTYENIIFSTAIEGTSMICVGKSNNGSFIDQMHSKFSREYLLVYILALVQRYTLLNLEDKLTHLDSSDTTTNEALWNLIDTVCRIKVNCYYSDVSIYTHYSQFYQLCCKNLHIPETFGEISEKIELLKLTTDRRLQEALEMQKEAHEKEIEESDRRNKILNFVVGVLTIAQVIQASYEIINHRCDLKMHVSLGVGAVGVIVLVLLMRKDIKKLFSK